MSTPSISDPQAVADRAESIYRDKYQEQYEDKHEGKFVAIDVATEKAYIGESPGQALQRARDADATSVFHLIRVGSPGAFRVSYTSDAADHWFPSQVR